MGASDISPATAVADTAAAGHRITPCEERSRGTYRSSRRKKGAQRFVIIIIRARNLFLEGVCSRMTPRTEEDVHVGKHGVGGGRDTK